MQEADKIERVTSLPEVPEDLPLQIFSWKVQKVCWAIIIVLMVLIAAGVFGNGPLSKVKETKGGITLEYERFSRYRGSLTTTVHLAAAEATADIRIPDAYLSKFQVETVFPESYTSKIENGAVIYSFDTKNNKTLTVHFFAHPEKTGMIRGEWDVNGTRFTVSHLIYP